VNIQPTKILAFAFYQVRTWFKTVSDDGFSDFKALVVVLAIEYFLLADAAGLASVLAGRLLIPTERRGLVTVVAAVVFGLGFANYRCIWKDGKWSRFKSEFDFYSVRVRVFGQIALVAAVIVSFVGVVVIGGFTRTLPK
jgi:hypothetical protein